MAMERSLPIPPYHAMPNMVYGNTLHGRPYLVRNRIDANTKEVLDE